MRKWIAAAALVAAMFASNAAQAQGREPSLYLRCDGEPNNMTGGEQFARFLGAITLLGIFAPSPEAPTPGARWFGERGVGACTELLESEDGETNAVRRVPLILARALHRIEAQDYAGALADVEIARAEAAAAGLVGNPYFDRSMGLSFNNIASAAHLRMGDPARARELSLSSVADMRYSFVPSLFADDFGQFQRDLSPAAETRLLTAAQVMPVLLVGYAAELDEAGRFADSARTNEALLATLEGIDDGGGPSSLHYARTAVSHALAGQWEPARNRAEEARTRMAALIDKGQPEAERASVIELLDLFSILEMVEAGDMVMARRMFAARSQWTAPSFGSVLQVTDTLREGAENEDLFGALALSGNEMWQRRYDDLMAVELRQDGENRSLFNLIVDYAQVDQFEDLSRNTWRVENSRMMVDEPDEDGQWAITAFGNPYSTIDSVMLHAALQARAAGKEGFTMLMATPRAGYGGAAVTGWVRFVDRGEDPSGDLLFIPADEVIAELGEVIPPRDVVRQRERDRRRDR